MAARVSQVYAEVVQSEHGEARVSQVYAEVVQNKRGSVRVSQAYVEVVKKIFVPPALIVITIGT